MSTLGEPELTLELKPRTRSRWLRASQWLWLALPIAAIVLAVTVGWPVVKHAQAFAYFTSMGAKVRWEEFDTTSTTGTTVNFTTAPENVTDDKLATLAWLFRLKMIDLTRCDHITDRGAASLGAYSELRELHLGRKRYEWATKEEPPVGPHLTDRGLSALANLTKLEILSLEGTEITDEGLKSLSRMTRLEILDLSHTTVSDAGIKWLVGLKKLRFVSLEGSRMTCEGVETLRRSLPEIQVLLEKCDPDAPKRKHRNGE
jgi:hypothetical protein